MSVISHNMIYIDIVYINIWIKYISYVGHKSQAFTCSPLGQPAWTQSPAALWNISWAFSHKEFLSSNLSWLVTFDFLGIILPPVHFLLFFCQTVKDQGKVDLRWVNSKLYFKYALGEELYSELATLIFMWPTWRTLRLVDINMQYVCSRH